MEPKHPFWTSLPGVLTGLAALVTAATGLFIATRPAAPAAVAPPAPAPQPAPAAPAGAGPAIPRTAVINDPDGFVNIRVGMASDTAIVGIIRDGEVFTVTPGPTSWWQVRTSSGMTGYVHKSRIVLK